MSDRSDEPRQLHAIVRFADHLLTIEDTPARRNLACIIRGYVELYAHYEPGEFPWWRVNEVLAKLHTRRRFLPLHPAAPTRPQIRPQATLVRHEGRWVTARWARNRVASRVSETSS